MLSLFGFPGTFGFIGKWYILQAVVHQRQVILPVVLVLTSVISAGYYLPVVMAMYMKPGRAESEAAASGRFGRFAAAAVAASVAAVILFGLWPAPAIDGVLRSGAALVESAPPIAAGE
jgi:NADH-quinone oxidoreductase subunit N